MHQYDVTRLGLAIERPPIVVEWLESAGEFATLHRKRRQERETAAQRAHGKGP
jgi:hypothetical protein